MAICMSDQTKKETKPGQHTTKSKERRWTHSTRGGREEKKKENPKYTHQSETFAKHCAVQPGPRPKTYALFFRFGSRFAARPKIGEALFPRLWPTQGTARNLCARHVLLGVFFFFWVPCAAAVGVLVGW